MVDLVIRDCLTRVRAKDPINRPTVITFVVQLGLNICDDFVWRQIVVAVDRTIVRIIRVRIVSPRRIPISRTKVEWERLGIDRYENDSVATMVPPPAAIVPLTRIIAKCPLLSSAKRLASPIIGDSRTGPPPKRGTSRSVHERTAAFLKPGVRPTIIEGLAPRWSSYSIAYIRPVREGIVRA